MLIEIIRAVMDKVAVLSSFGISSKNTSDEEDALLGCVYNKIADTDTARRALSSRQEIKDWELHDLLDETYGEDSYRR